MGTPDGVTITTNGNILASAAWFSSVNPVLPPTAIGMEVDTGKSKIGDGQTVYATLSYAIQPGAYDAAGAAAAAQAAAEAAAFKSQTQIITTSGSITAPSWATVAHAISLGGGGGGAGAGSADTTSGVTAQIGAPGGPAGVMAEAVVSVTGGATVAVVIGAGGTAGAGGAVNGGAGTYGNSGGTTTVTIGGVLVMESKGGPTSNAESCPGNSTTMLAAYTYGSSGLSTTSNDWTPGGGPSGSYTEIPTPYGTFGGAGGGAATTTLGGGGGQGQTAPGIGMSPGASGGSATANGVNGITATIPGAGGGGGGGGAPGGTGGAGGAGALGLVVIEWRSA